VYAQGGTPRTDAEAGADAWHQMLQFLEAGASAHINKISPQDLDS
jgi:hypothetical protein